MTERPACSDERIWDVWLAAFHAPTLAIADELGLFRALEPGPLSTRELADRLGIELRATETMAGLLASLGFLVGGDRFALAEIARTYLLPQSPYYWGGLLRRIRETPLDCRTLIASLRRGAAADDARLTEMWQTPRPPDAALIAFTHAMHAHSFALAMRTVPVFGLARSSLLDVGGGSGSYAIAAALHDPTTTCTVLDFAAVCTVAAEYAATHGVGDRVHTAAGDMFADAWPRDHDHVLFSDIFHDWDDARCRILAERAFAALPPGGRVLVHEMLLDDGGLGPINALAYSMIMVFVARGRQRRAREIIEILTSAGFRSVDQKLTANGFSLLTATK